MWSWLLEAKKLHYTNIHLLLLAFMRPGGGGGGGVLDCRVILADLVAIFRLILHRHFCNLEKEIGKRAAHPDSLGNSWKSGESPPLRRSGYGLQTRDVLSRKERILLIFYCCQGCQNEPRSPQSFSPNCEMIYCGLT